MKIAVVTTQTLFAADGPRDSAGALAARLRERGHAVELVKVPIKEHPLQAVADRVLSCRLLRLGAGDPDLVIALKFPTYLTPFPNKKVWLAQQFRPVYDLGETPTHADEAARGLRDMIVRADCNGLSQARSVFAGSARVARRLKWLCRIDAEDVLYQPLDRTDLYQPGEFGDYFFSAGAPHLAGEAMRHVRAPFRLMLESGSGEGRQELLAALERWEVRDRVVILESISQEARARCLSGACALLDFSSEDVTLEAFHSHKPVVTAGDSGGASELVEDEVNGRVVEPSPEALAEAMEALYADRQHARELGQAARETLDRFRINWDWVVERLTAA